MMKPGLTLYQQSKPLIMSLNVDDSSLEVNMLNQKIGKWEPMVERFHAGVQITQTPEGSESSATHVVIRGHSPLLLNVTPAAVRQASWLAPLFVSSLWPAPELQDGDPARGVGAGHSSGTKYRVLNLCDFPLELGLMSRHGTSRGAMQVKPTGSLWEPLDDFVLRGFVTALVVRLPAGQGSEPLNLERTGAAEIPAAGAVAELLAPSPSQRVLLLASKLRVHNSTGFTLVVRFHDPSQREVLMVDVRATASCDAALFGCEPSEQECSQPGRKADWGGGGSGPSEPDSVLVLAPNSVGAVPAPALLKAKEGGRSSKAWISLKPDGLGMGFSETFVVGARAATHSARCSAETSEGGAGAAEQELMHFVCEAHTSSSSSSPSVEVTTVTVCPPLVLLNALPIGNLTVAYNSQAHGAPVSQWQRASIPRLSHLSLYSFPGVLHESGISVSARLGDDAPWSARASFNPAAFRESTGVASLGLQQSADGAAAGLLAEVAGGSRLRFSCPSWFVDRSGLSRPLAVELLWHGSRLPAADGVTLLPPDCTEEGCEILLRSACSTFAQHRLSMPPNWSTLAWRTPCGPFIFCLQRHDAAGRDVFGARCQVMTLRPRLVLTNASLRDLEVHLGGSRMLRIAAGESMESHWALEPGDSQDLPTTSLRFRPLGEGPPGPWSGLVLCADEAAGSIPLLLEARGGGEPEVWSVEVAPERGALAVSFRQGSDFVAADRTTRARVTMSIRPQGREGPQAEIQVPKGASVQYGWPEPFRSKRKHAVDVVVNGRSFPIADVRRRTLRRVLHEFNVVLLAARIGEQTALLLQDHEVTGDVAAEPTAGTGSWLTRIEVKLSHVAISVMAESPKPHELFTLHLDLVRAEYRQNDDDIQQLRLAISDAQVDCQLPGRVDARTSDRRRQQSLGLLRRERPAVIFANRGDGDRAFLGLFVQRSATSSGDLLLPFVDLALDTVDFTVDDDWLGPLAAFVQDSTVDAPARRAQDGLRVADVIRTAGKPVTEEYRPPAVPSVVQVDAMQISAVNLTVWCNLKLESVHFLPGYVRTAIRVLSLSGKLSLDAAHLALPPRRLLPHRGSLVDFVRGLANEYTLNLLHNAGAVLGKSSVLNLPRMPVKLGGTAISYLTDSIGLLTGEAASLLTTLTLDDDYVAQQRQIRSGKQIQSLKQGVAEASMSLLQGVEGIFDVVRKPVEGAQRSGLSGFLVGVGKGMAGSFVKPISKVGQAISDVGSGIAAQATPDSASMKRRRARLRRRQPRLLFGQGALRPWSELEAELLGQLGERLTQGVEEVIPLTQQGSQRAVLLLYLRHMLLAEVKMQESVAQIS